ncbi:uncharacterized protein LOC122455657 [Dermochelys coriacea]|uniref:uncharacterized protein LOC122455657 n=1 Tax=Dermochelys coriacea TaxID=27794 RepID=UPI001CA9CE54|nr:uncharacterized protein LOC122455657 [Dermochelys coriacea]XP_043347684.1 uncharacterized protein LOC122455657 [Dermochelys coriacea]XP_043347685.1 uncharacterized protein LOC122455657 [Dermochelys coriacea]XP_043347686.1 uncharacterized protein LOC122455657 [Dermochelys coriacea]XP_043347687.1 uncharacterized protein LOC122455657 [Dermochelys coriacea]XP_043347688.1 uncharacterized protein LOC122455657 [Dermochelys coriacea]
MRAKATPDASPLVSECHSPACPLCQCHSPVPHLSSANTWARCLLCANVMAQCLLCARHFISCVPMPQCGTSLCLSHSPDPPMCASTTGHYFLCANALDQCLPCANGMARRFASRVLTSRPCASLRVPAPGLAVCLSCQYNGLVPRGICQCHGAAPHCMCANATARLPALWPSLLPPVRQRRGAVCRCVCAHANMSSAYWSLPSPPIKGSMCHPELINMTILQRHLKTLKPCHPGMFFCYFIIFLSVLSPRGCEWQSYLTCRKWKMKLNGTLNQQGSTKTGRASQKPARWQPCFTLACANINMMHRMPPTHLCQHHRPMNQISRHAGASLTAQRTEPLDTPVPS